MSNGHWQTVKLPEGIELGISMVIWFLKQHESYGYEMINTISSHV
jgi:hypothetical protein